MIFLLVYVCRRYFAVILLITLCAVTVDREFLTTAGGDNRLLFEFVVQLNFFQRKKLSGKLSFRILSLSQV